MDRAAIVITFDHVRAAAQLNDFNPLAAHRQMAPARRALFPEPDKATRKAAVLELIYPEEETLHIILTRRSDTLRGHSGQISFPGGSHDSNDASYAATALRETREELGICEHKIEIIGTLTKIYIPPSNFDVYPILALTPTPPKLRPNPAEVAEVLSLSLVELVMGDIKRSERRRFQGRMIEIPYYFVRGHKVWGATATMLGELEYRLRATLSRNKDITSQE